MKKTFSNISFRIPYDTEVRIPVSPKRVYLLLHGFKQTGSFIFDSLKSQLPEDCAVIAPNGPFHIPVEKDDGYHMRFAWYFFDPIRKSYFVDYKPAAEFIKSILIEMNLVKTPVTVIGYSQGGYLAPKVAELIPSVDTVIGLACAFRNQHFDVRKSVMIHQINSNSDPIIDFDGAKDEFQKLRERGNLGRFVELDGVGHRLTNDYLLELSQLI